MTAFLSIFDLKRKINYSCHINTCSIRRLTSFFLLLLSNTRPVICKNNDYTIIAFLYTGGYRVSTTIYFGYMFCEGQIIYTHLAVQKKNENIKE